MTISIILVRPQMGENIGAAARVMKNFGLSELRIISPRDGWPNDKAISMSAGAEDILGNTQVFDTLEEAVADIQYLLATSARRRDMEKPVISSRDMPAKIEEKLSQNVKCGIMFGAERTGLENSEAVLADSFVNIPVNPEYYSLNLAQAVALMCYEVSATESVIANECEAIHFYQKINRLPRRYAPHNDEETKPATSSLADKKDLLGFFHHLESELDRANHFLVPEKRKKMVGNIRNMFLRAELTDQEIRTLRGIITSLCRRES